MYKKNSYQISFCLDDCNVATRLLSDLFQTKIRPFDEPADKNFPSKDQLVVDKISPSTQAAENCSSFNASLAPTIKTLTVLPTGNANSFLPNVDKFHETSPRVTDAVTSFDSFQSFDHFSTQRFSAKFQSRTDPSQDEESTWKIFTKSLKNYKYVVVTRPLCLVESHTLDAA